jgi:hypothetical protein
MTQSSHAIELDFNELVRIIARELDSAFQVSQPSRDGVEKLHIASVRVKLGQRLRPKKQATETDEQGKEAAQEDSPQPFLLLERYTPAKQGWMFEMELSAGPTPLQARNLDGPWVSLPLPPGPALAELFRDMETTVLKGVARKWASTLKENGITTVGDLMSLGQKEWERLLRITGSTYPLELRFRSLLLGAGIPEIPASPADRNSLFQLVAKSPQELRTLIGPKRFSATASEQLSFLLSLLYTIIDHRVLKRTRLERLRTVSMKM